MLDAPEKTRFAVQMAVATRALVNVTSDAHRKRVVGRYVFVYLHDVVRYAPAWRNALAKDDSHYLTAEAALPALTRLRKDWEQYQEIRHYIGAKRQPRDSTDAAVDQLASFKLWADIGELSVGTLVDDAVELYVQLAAATSLPQIEIDPQPPPAVVEALTELDGVGEAGLLEMTATSFGAGKTHAFPVRQGGEIGGLVPLLNDIAENIQTLRAIADKASDLSVFDQLIRCQLPTELDELLRLSVGPAPNLPASDSQASLLDLYSKPDKAPEPRQTLEQLRSSVPDETRESLHEWRNRIGAHIDDETPWPELEDGITHLDIESVVRLAGHVVLWLEVAAAQPGGPVLLMLSSHRMKSFVDSLRWGGAGLSYTDPDVDPGSVSSALPPPELDSDVAVWVGGQKGSFLSAAVAGMIAGRNRELAERLEVAQASEATPRDDTERG